jgi:hypothetical protein
MYRRLWQLLLQLLESHDADATKNAIYSLGVPVLSGSLSVAQLFSRVYCCLKV